MADIFEGLKPEPLWKHFAKILSVPRCSGKEKAMGDYIAAAGKAAGLVVKRDEVGNVCVEKPASPGREKAPGVILQCHQDMVCEKNSDVAFDFAKDTIRARLKDGWVQAQGTTLGADNGIGIAACLAVMEDKSLIHGPLEFLCTIDEERGLTGANKIKAGFLKGTRLLNLDSEEEGAFTIGCSGGADTELALALKRKKARGKSVLRELKISGLRGGHSGIDINQGRGNAIKILARLLWQAQQKFGLEIVRLEAGSKRNAIPREAWAHFLVAPGEVDRLSAFLSEAFAKVKDENKVVETELKYSFEKAKGTAAPLAPASQKALLNFLLALPHGVLAMHPEIAGLVETSTNLAIVSVKKAQAQVICSSRSSIGSALEAVKNGLKALADLAQAKAKLSDGYPGWAPNLQSRLLKTLKDLHLKVFGKAAAVAAIHAGLECGIIGEKFPGMDMISFGPTIQHPHSPEERVNAESVEHFWKFLTAALESLS
ncbi:MAG: cytosol nonspecific dipeptidase [Candidatus Aminicenantes bacterium RBG_13_63_10]|nr:MAG: cytosol nonspecific dipeptidase [Candidatus Aminicenantes bacterium RBG_13_63_10]